MSIDYWLGLATIPAIAIVGAVSVFATLRTLGSLKRRGITFDIRMQDVGYRVDDYTLRHNIWWERTFGPIFAGGWYRDNEQGRRRINRWIAVGRLAGPHFAIYRSRDLGPSA